MPYETFFNLPEEKRQAILDVLLDEFAENDYRSVSISRIVDRAGIAKGSFYQYFEDKKDCYQYLIQLAMEEKTRFMQQAAPLEGGADMFTILRWMFKAGLTFEFSNPRLSQIGYRALFDDVPLPEGTLSLIHNGGQAFFAQMIEQNIEAGTVREDVDPVLTAFLLNTIFNHLGQFLLERFDISAELLLEKSVAAFSADEVVKDMDQVISILEHGLHPGA